MAVSVSSAPLDSPAGLRFSTGEITFDSSYPTAGEAVTTAQWGGGSNGLPSRSPDFVLFQVVSPTTTNKTPSFIKATGKVTLYGTAASVIGVTESTNATDHSLTIVRFLAIWIAPTVPPVTA